MQKTLTAMSIALACCGAVLVNGAFASSDPKVHALVIGIDTYDHIGSLAGAVNDARDIADALSDLPGADVTVLLDEAATRDAILKTWRAKAERAQSGDTLIITYAGHGGHEPEAYQGNETDGRDETLLLGGFSSVGNAASHRIRDDEIADLIASVPQDVTVIFVADSCHSGTVVRSTRKVHSYRYYAGGEIKDDPLPPPPPKTRPDDVIGKNTIFLSAVADDKQAPEFLVEDEVRGALSIAFAEAMRGNADKNRDGSLSKGELERHIRETVKSISSGIQNPQIGPVGQIDRRLVSLRADTVATLEPIVTVNPFQRSFDMLPRQKLWSDDADTLEITGSEPASSPTNATLIVDFSEGGIFSSIGDQLADLPDEPAQAALAVQSMTDKQRIVAEIRSYDPLQPLDISFQGGNGTYLEGDSVVAHVAGRETEKIWLLHLSSTGEITHLFPLTQYNDDTRTAPSNTLAIPLGVTAPYGADTIIAIEAGTDLPAVDQILARFDQSTDVATLWNDLHSVLGQRDDVAASVFSFFTAPAGE